MYKSENFQISLWLVSLMSIILLMIIVGGLTRLTESGLSMVDWRLFMGTIPPLSHGDWLKVFEDYKQYPEYQIKNINMTLSEFKYIFWWEYGHRVLGRLIGIIFIIPFVYFAYKKYFSKADKNVIREQIQIIAGENSFKKFGFSPKLKGKTMSKLR